MSRRPLALPLLLLALGAPAAGAATGPCRPDGDGPTCQIEIATVPRVGGVNDGDTIDAAVGGRREHVRFLAIQAAELTRYSVTPGKRRGECSALAATNAVEQLIRQGHHRVRLAAQQPRRDSAGRLLRSVAVRIGGRWRDVGEILMRRGLTLWMHNTVETAWNEIYDRLGQQAAQRGLGLWNPALCGKGPSPGVPFDVWVMSDPVGDDTRDINSEYVRVRNRSATQTVSLTGWYLSDSGPKPTRFHFPAGTRLGPGQTLTARTGSGTSSGLTFYRGLPGTVFENSANGGGAGGGAYLYDPRGNLRAHMTYPCLVACTDPDQGALAVTANAIRGPEYAEARNVSGRPLDLFGYELRLPGAYAFPEGTVLQPGETVRVFVQGDPSADTRLVKHIGYGGAYLPDSGGTAQVTTFDEIVLGCDAWGSGRC